MKTCETCGQSYDPKVKNQATEHERVLCGYWRCNGDRRCFESSNSECTIHGK